MYRSYSVNNMPEPVTHRPDKPAKQSPSQKTEDSGMAKHEKKGGIFDNLQNDDIILLVVIFILLVDDCDDKLLIAALAFIFLSGGFQDV